MVNRTLQPLYSGGSVSLSEDGRVLAACAGEDALLTNLTTGKELGRVEGVRLHAFCVVTIGTNSSRRTERSLLRWPVSTFHLV